MRKKNINVLRISQKHVIFFYSPLPATFFTLVIDVRHIGETRESTYGIILIKKEEKTCVHFFHSFFHFSYFTVVRQMYENMQINFTQLA